MKNESIKCNVSTCSYNDKTQFCTLKDISVGSSVPTPAHTKSDTECSSFKAE